MSSSPRPAVAVAASLAAGLVAAAPVHGASYEQISRASGVAGATQVLVESKPLFAGDDGIVAAASVVDKPDRLFSPQRTGLRNTVTNTTTYPHPEAGQLVSTDRTGTVGLYQRDDFATSEYVWSVGSVGGAGTTKDVARLSFSVGWSAELSGDGRSVVVSDDETTRRVSVSTGSSTVLSTPPLAPAPYYGQSDDARVVGGLVTDADGATSGVILADRRRISVPGWPWIAPDGRTASWLGGPSGDQTSPALYTYTVATGRTTSVALPATVEQSYLITWISPDGARVVVAETGTGEPTFSKPAMVLDRRSGRWSTFGGPYAGSIKSAYNHTAISRNGRYAAVAFNGQVALVNLGGAPLLGNLLGLEPVSASSYVDVRPTGLFGGCGDFATAGGQFERPAAWIAAPRSVQVTLAADGVVFKRETLTKTESAPGAGDGDRFGAIFPAGTTTGTVTISVVDGAGRTMRETFSKRLTC